jgi:hypothetical protein
MASELVCPYFVSLAFVMASQPARELHTLTSAVALRFLDQGPGRMEAPRQRGPQRGAYPDF